MLRSLSWRKCRYWLLQRLKIRPHTSVVFKGYKNVCSFELFIAKFSVVLLWVSINVSFKISFKFLKHNIQSQTSKSVFSAKKLWKMQTDCITGCFVWHWHHWEYFPVQHSSISHLPFALAAYARYCGKSIGWQFCWSQTSQPNLFLTSVIRIPL